MTRSLAAAALLVACLLAEASFARAAAVRLAPGAVGATPTVTATQPAAFQRRANITCAWETQPGSNVTSLYVAA